MYGVVKIIIGTQIPVNQNGTTTMKAEPHKHIGLRTDPTGIGWILMASCVQAVKVDGCWYCFNNSGAMKTGWHNDGAKDNPKWHYLNSTGAMQTGWLENNGSWYYMNKDGLMHIRWLLDGDTCYYLRSNGVMATVSQFVTGYTFDDSGAFIGY